MRKSFLAGLVLLAVVVVAAVWWYYRPGTFSYANYKRIHPGMSLAQVEELLGGPGESIQSQRLPLMVDSNVPKPVVSGEEYFLWKGGGSFIVISLSGGVVAEGNYWTPNSRTTFFVDIHRLDEN